MSKPSTAEAHKPNLDCLKNFDTWYNVAQFYIYFCFLFL